MTAIAWDGMTLATDTQYDSGGICGYTPKLFTLTHPVIGKIIVGLSGTTRGSLLMISQLEKDIIKQVDDYDVTISYGIAVDSGKNVYNIYGDGHLCREHSDNRYCVGGSAWQFLMGAMVAGASAAKAVRLAIEHRTDAGNRYEALVWSEVFERCDNEESHDDIPF